MEGSESSEGDYDTFEMMDMIFSRCFLSGEGDNETNIVDALLRVEKAVERNTRALQSLLGGGRSDHTKSGKSGEASTVQTTPVAGSGSVPASGSGSGSAPAPAPSAG